MSEASLLREVENSPEIDRIELSTLESDAEYKTTLDDYSLSFIGEAREEHSNEKGSSGPNQALERLSSLSLEVEQPLPYGVTIGAGYSNSRTKPPGQDTYAQAKLVGKLTVDLLKDLFGRTSLAELENAELGHEEAKLRKTIDRKAFQLRVRKLFWDYAAASESRDIALKMLRSDKKEFKLVKEKRAIDVADDGDVARFASQVSERTAQKFQFEATMKQLEIEFKQLLPQLNGRNIKISKYNKDLKIAEFFTCLDLIGSHKKTPLEYSKFDELVALKQERLGKQEQSLDAYSDIDLKLEGEFGISGSDAERSESSKALFDDRDGFAAVGLRVTVPLDSKRKNSEIVQLAAVRKRFDAESKELLARLDSFHGTIVDAINLIKSVVVNRDDNSKHLSVALKDSREKYRQARITSQQLLEEKERYFNNELALVSTQRDLIQLMLDYFALFTDTPCTLNKVQL